MPAPTPLATVKQVCTASEAALVRASRDESTANLPAPRLAIKRDRARALRDKFRGLADRQRREQRGKQEPRGRAPAEGNDRTRLKVTIFAEALERFEKMLAKVSRGDGTASAATASAGPARRAPRKTPADASDRKAMRSALNSGVRSKTGAATAQRAGSGAAASTPSRTPASGASPKSSGRTAAAANTSATNSSAKASSAKASSGSSAKASGQTTGKPTSKPTGKPTSKTSGKASGKTMQAKKTAKRPGKLPYIKVGAPSASLLEVIAGTKPGLLSANPTEVSEQRQTARAQRRTSKAEAGAAARIESRIGRSGAIRHLGHVAARNRRSQAKRDAR